MEENLKEYIKNSIINSTLILKPFRYLIVDELCPNDFFKKLKEYVKNIKDVERFTIVNNRWHFKSDKWTSYLKILQDELYNDDVQKILNENFKIQLEKRKEYMSLSTWEHDLTIDLKNYEIPPHLDGPTKQLSILYYITGNKIGTSLYNNGDCLDYTKAKKVDEVKFKENRLFVFCPSIYDRTWHEVEKTNEENTKRITIQANLNLKINPIINWHSFGIGSIRSNYKPRNDTFID